MTELSIRRRVQLEISTGALRTHGFYFVLRLVTITNGTGMHADTGLRANLWGREGRSPVTY